MKVLKILLIWLFILPAFTPWMPHNAIHAFHDHQEKHHSIDAHHHDESEHDHKSASKQALHHAINFDASTYFNDYLHVDLQNAEQIVLKSPVFETQGIDYVFSSVVNIVPRQKLITIQSRAPPDTGQLLPSNIPLYLSTQRIRV